MRSDPGDAPDELDQVDRRILSRLVRDARLSSRAIAREIGMSGNAVNERIQRLEERGTIRGYFADLEPSALGYGMLAIIGLQTLHGPELDETIKQLLAIPEVQEAHIVTGQWDLIVQLRVRDNEHLQHVLLEGVWKLKAFRHSETMIVLRSHRRPGAWAPPAIRGADLDGRPG